MLRISTSVSSNNMTQPFSHLFSPFLTFFSLFLPFYPFFLLNLNPKQTPNQKTNPTKALQSKDGSRNLIAESQAK
jgi:hypothetical protein